MQACKAVGVEKFCNDAPKAEVTPDHLLFVT